MKTLFLGLLAFSVFAQAPATPAAGALRENGVYARISL